MYIFVKNFICPARGGLTLLKFYWAAAARGEWQKKGIAMVDIPRDGMIDRTRGL
jgi:hypothetical protein